MYLKHVTIENFRGIEAMELNLHPGVNLLIGDNGVGKTSVLEAIVAGLGACFKELSGISAVPIRPQDIRQELQVVDGSPSVKFHAPTRIHCEMQIDDQVYEWTRSKKDESSGARHSIEYPRGGQRIADWFRDTANEIYAPLPVLSYKGLKEDPEGKRAGSIQLNDRRYGYAGCLESAVDGEVMRKWIYAMMRKRGSSPRYDLFRDTVRQVMWLLDPDSPRPDIEFSEEFGEFGEFVYTENGSTMPISYLSAGYRSALRMVMDITFRALLLNPAIQDAADIFGIVLIDEVDNHLHPKWQWNILDALHQTFPRVQFIITTHAPIVISSCRNAAVTTISADHEAKPQEKAYGYRIEDVIHYTQGANPIIPELTQLYEKFENACVRKDYEAAKNCFEALDREFPKSTERAKAQTRLRFMKIGG